MMTSRFLPCKRNSLVRTCRVAHQSSVMVFLTFNINKNMVKLLSSKSVTLNIEKWADLIQTINTTTIKSKEGITTILNKSTENRKDRLKNRKKVWMNRAMLGITIMSMLIRKKQETKKQKATKRVGANLSGSLVRPARHMLAILPYQTFNPAPN